ncbi:hypothetical protein BOX15_Mlig025973g2 [Macrostomum lignano]|uniref:Uncharacterized protein n=2 Tax=Macrostomum lignano TaxID=282301 RepID=A0A267FG36_9PLAT|nr:hypothetical protein BOX15_Mlig025973g2 [Macrostomum lignano]
MSSTATATASNALADAKLSSSFACINRRTPVRAAWSDTRHRVKTAPSEKPANYLAGLVTPSLLVVSEPVRRHCATASLPLRHQQQQQQHQHQQLGEAPTSEESALPKTAPPASRTFQLGPGFQLTRSRDRVLVTLDSDQLSTARQQKAETVAKQSRTVEEAQRDALVGQMQKHLDSLVVMLEEERLKRREEIEALTAEMQEKLEAQSQAHEGRIIDLLAQHQTAVQQVEKERQEQAQEADSKYSLMRKELESQIAYLKSSFDTFKDSYTKDLDEKWRKKEAELIAEGEARAKRLVDEATSELLKEREAEVEALKTSHNTELQKFQLEHEKELSELHNRYSDMEGTVQRLNSATRDLVAKEEKVKSLTSQLESRENEVASLERNLANTRSELAAFKARLDERVRLVDEKYKARMATMRLEAVDLRKAYITKCEQLVESRKTEDTKLGERVYKSKEIMRDVIKARHRVEVSMAALDPSEEDLPPMPFDRRFSQPTTVNERELAVRSAGHHEDDF